MVGTFSTSDRLPAVRLWLAALAALATLMLSGCDLLGVETASQIEARRTAEGRAIGSACRHAVRSIEDCYASNPRSPKSAIFDGWREMDEYMRDNDIPGMPHNAATQSSVGTGAPAPTLMPGAAAPAASSASNPPTGAISLPGRPNIVPPPTGN